MHCRVFSSIPAFLYPLDARKPFSPPTVVTVKKIFTMSRLRTSILGRCIFFFLVRGERSPYLRFDLRFSPIRKLSTRALFFFSKQRIASAVLLVHLASFGFSKRQNTTDLYLLTKNVFKNLVLVKKSPLPSLLLSAILTSSSNKCNNFDFLP